MRSLAIVAALLVVTGCSDNGDDDNITTLPDPTTGPYVVVAVDNHFHDIHPADDKEISADRAFVVENEGSNLHNFSVEGTDISQDVRPGRALRFDPLGDALDPGTYSVFCRYHVDAGMKGRFTVTE